jgi:calcium/proton exchanger cax
MAYALLLFIPLSLALRYIFDAPHSWVFLTGSAAIAVLADWLRRATDQLAERAGSTIGGLLNISFGNTAELILALFVLSRAHARIVQAQITGSIIGTTLLFSRHLETAATLTGGAAIQRLLCSGGTGTQRVTVTEFAVLNGCGRHRLANSSPYPILIE